MSSQTEILADLEENARIAYETAVTAELNKLVGMPNYSKRCHTIRRLAMVEVTPGLTAATVHKEPGVVSYKTFINKQKAWAHHPLFAAVLEAVKALTRDYYGKKALREEEAARAAQRARELEAAALAHERHMQGLRLMQFTEREVVERYPDGRPQTIVVLPTKAASPQSLVALGRFHSDIGRRALNMTQEITTLTGQEGAPALIQIYLPDNHRDGELDDDDD